jgi:lipopolysaccharide transport system ATP-binding protein
MYLRLAFAVAAHLEPEILIVDEVLAVGDASFQRRCLRKMGEVSGEGRTVVLVSHNMAAITSLATECLWIEHGRVREAGRPDEVVAAYLSSDLVAGQPGYAELADPAVRQGVPKPTHGELTFDWIRLADARGERSAVFFEDEPLRVELGLDAKVEAESVEIVIKVQTVEGMPVFALMSGARPVDARPGKLETAVVVPRLPLRPGRYQLDLYALTRLPQDYVTSAISFEVVGARGAVGDPRLTREDASLGAVRVEQEWESPRQAVPSRV